MAVAVCKNMGLCTSERLVRLASWLTVGQINGSVTWCMKGVGGGLNRGGLLTSFRS